MSEEWGDWKDHDGKGCPCRGMMVHCQYEDQTFWPPCIATGNPEAWDHDYAPKRFLKIIRYRIRKPRGMTILEELIADLPQPATEKGTA